MTLSNRVNRALRVYYDYHPNSTSTNDSKQAYDFREWYQQAVKSVKLGMFLFSPTGKILNLWNLINLSPNVPVDPRASVVMAIDCSFELIYFLAWHDNFRLFSSSDWCVCCDCPFAFQTQLGFVVEEPRIFENYFHLYLSVKKVSYDDLFSQSWLDFLFVEANKYNIILIKGLKKGLIISMKYYQENTFNLTTSNLTRKR